MQEMALVAICLTLYDKYLPIYVHFHIVYTKMGHYSVKNQVK